MSPAELEQYLHRHIPLSREMGVSVVSADDDTVMLGAPLAPNRNHRNTVFGGSASALAMLACWSLLHTRLRGQGIEARLVIQRNTMDFKRPIIGEFSARATLPLPDRWEAFTRMLARKGKGRITVTARLESEGLHVGQFTGDFVAIHGASQLERAER